MDKRDKEIIKNVSEAISGMSDFEKGYLLGVAESKLASKVKGSKEDKKEPVTV